MLEEIHPSPDPSIRVKEFASWLADYLETSTPLLDPEATYVQEAFKAYQAIANDSKTLQNHLDFIKGILAADTINLETFVANPVFVSSHPDKERGVPNGIYDKENMNGVSDHLIMPLPVLKAKLKKFYEGMHSDMAQLKQNHQPLNEEQSLIQEWMEKTELCLTTKDDNLAINPEQPERDDVNRLGSYLLACMMGSMFFSFAVTDSFEDDADYDNRSHADQDSTPNGIVPLACFLAPIILTAGVRGELPFQRTVTRGFQSLYANVRNTLTRPTRNTGNELPLIALEEPVEEPVARGPDQV